MGWLRRAPDAAYYDHFEAAAANATHAAELLASLLGNYPDEAGLARQILLCEQQGDRTTHAIVRLISAGARPPLPQLATHRLATGIDDIVDHIEQVADSLELYRIEAPMDPSPALAEVLLAATRELGAAVQSLRGGTAIGERLAEVHRLETEGDRLTREAIAALFDGGVDPMVVIRWKDIFEQLEQAIDACEDVANILEIGVSGV